METELNELVQRLIREGADANVVVNEVQAAIRKTGIWAVWGEG